MTQCGDIREACTGLYVNHGQGMVWLHAHYLVSTVCRHMRSSGMTTPATQWCKARILVTSSGAMCIRDQLVMREGCPASSLPCSWRLLCWL